MEDVEAALQFLIDKYPPLVARLPRAPGTKEARYAHLLSGEERLEQHATAASFSGVAESASRTDRVAQLEEEVARLRSDIESLQQQFAEFRRQFE